MKNLFIILISAFSIYAQGFILAVGGGSEDEGGWSDKPYGWMVEKADSGKIIVISYEDDSNGLPNYFDSLGAEESYLLNIDNRSIADQQETYDDLLTAQGIFIKGGDQGRYYSSMNGTLAEQAIMEVFQNGGVIGGTSAGAMVLSEYSSLDTVYPDEALENPLTGYINIKDDFLNLMPNALFDTHFIQRGRWGRLIPFIYNIKSKTGNEIIGIGIDDQTAVCIDKNLIGTVYGTGAVSIFQIDEQTRIVDQGSEYTIDGIKCDQLTENWSFDFNTKTISDIPSSAREVTFPIPAIYVNNDSYLFGDNTITSQFNEYLDEFLSVNNSKKIGLLFNSGYEVYVDIIADTLTARAIDHVMIPVDENLVPEQSTADLISESNAFIFLGNDLEKLSALSDRQTLAGEAYYTKMVENAPVYYTGITVKLNGETVVNDTETNPNASYYGRMTLTNGLGNTPDVVYQNDLFEDDDFFENRSASVLYGMMRGNKRIGVYIDENSFLKTIRANQSIELISDDMPIMIVDGRNRTYADSSTYEMSSTADPRQVVAMNDLRYSVSTLEKSYNLIEGKLSPISSVDNNEEENVEFSLHQNYPNPFNPTTSIKYQVSSMETIRLKVFDVLGREVTTLVNEVKLPGIYEIQFNGTKLASGVYFYRLTAGNFVQTKKMLLLK